MKRTAPHNKDHHFSSPRKKKAFGQHFLRKQSTVDNMIAKVALDSHTRIIEIGCGDGFLTRSLLAQTPCPITVIEIDEEWATIVRNSLPDQRLTIVIQDVLDHDLTQHKKDNKLVLLANLPYQITFPLLYKFAKNYTLFDEGVIMIQEEVAQKLVATRGKSYSAATVYLQYYFSFSLMEKVEPGAFSPPPSIFSRLVHFTPQKELPSLTAPEAFWDFVRICFAHPRQTLKNNLKHTSYWNDSFPAEYAGLRAQQLTFEQFREIWHTHFADRFIEWK